MSEVTEVWKESKKLREKELEENNNPSSRFFGTKEQRSGKVNWDDIKKMIEVKKVGYA